VRSWLLWTQRQFNLQPFALEYFSMDGMTLCSLTESDFKQRAPHCGEILYAQLDIWKTDDISDDACDLPSNSNAEPANATPTSTGGRSGSGSHIHLWQFLKELLSQPQLYGSCIRWLDRPKGIFKIEDSVRVARLWGKRKNRPAMNYDKLSRSIRQYYKKGIMKKTERSQRLVYQFCHPYCL
jgi:SAM pointed domain-containing ETS transcription factor